MFCIVLLDYEQLNKLLHQNSLFPVSSPFYRQLSAIPIHRLTHNNSKSHKIVHKERPLSPAKRTEPTISVHTRSPIREPILNIKIIKTPQNCRTQNGSISPSPGKAPGGLRRGCGERLTHADQPAVWWDEGSEVMDGFLRPKNGTLW